MFTYQCLILLLFLSGRESDLISINNKNKSYFTVNKGGWDFLPPMAAVTLLWLK